MTMDKDIMWERKVKGHQKRWPVDAMETIKLGQSDTGIIEVFILPSDIFPNDVDIRWPSIFASLTGREGVSCFGQVVYESVQPDIDGLCVVTGDGNAPG